MLTCREGRDLGYVEMPGPGRSEGGLEGRFTVSADCPIQALPLIVRPSDAASGSSGQVDFVELTRVMGAAL